MMRNLTQHQGQETTQLASDQEDDTNEETPRRRNHKASMAETNTVGEPNRILIRNIGHPATKDIEALLARFGPITKTKMPVDRLTGRHMGSAFMTLTTAENAATAISTLNGTSFKGRTLHLTPARAEWPRQSRWPKPAGSL